jgi:hypothetical protein
MKLSENAKKELFELSQSLSFKKDMDRITTTRYNPFFSDGKVNADAYIEFVNQFNEFINHSPKPFKPMIEKEMKL